MNELIKVNYDNSERPTVSGRDLHEFLEVETAYTTWFIRMSEYSFIEGTDFLSILEESHKMGRPAIDHQLTIDMAKEICMLQRNEKGKQARRSDAYNAERPRDLPAFAGRDEGIV